MKKERLLELAGISENDDPKIFFDSEDIGNILSKVGHEADTQGAPDDVRDKRYPVSPEEAWSYGVEWALDKVGDLT